MGKPGLVVVGYGSLVWKPPPHTVRKIPGFVKGVVRRFAQSSNDHRGTPERPGRVVTVVKTEDWRTLTGESTTDDAVVWGVGWEIDDAKRVEVKDYLDHREKNGYSEERVTIYNIIEGKEVVVAEEALMYVGKIDNEAFIGSQPIQELAERIISCSGPSGDNKEYLYNLAAAVRSMDAGVEDEYLFELEAAVRALDLKESGDTLQLK